MGIVPTQITVSACSDGACPQNVIEEGSTFTISGRLTYSIFPYVNLPMSGSLVYVYVSGLVNGNFQVNTDSNGNFSFQLQSPNQTGQITVEAEYKGNEEFDSSKSVVNAVVLSQSDFNKYVTEKNISQIAQYLVLAGILGGVGVLLGVVFSK